MSFKWEQVGKKEEGLEKLRILIKEISANLNKEGVPVNDDCRIETRAFGDVYVEEEIARDQKGVEELEKKWQEKEGERIQKDGEQLETLKTIIFSKFLGNDFIVARASLYDDIRNKVDNVILDKKTGNLVCALDEVASISGKEFEDKKRRALARNTEEGGGRLKYGLRMEEEKLVLGAVDHFPLFYLALPPDRIREAINRLGPTLDQKTDYETKLFSYFISSIDSQIKGLKLFPPLDQVLKRSIELFEGSLKKFGK